MSAKVHRREPGDQLLWLKTQLTHSHRRVLHRHHGIWIPRQRGFHSPADGEFVALHVDLDKADRKRRILGLNKVVDAEQGYLNGIAHCAGILEMRGDHAMVAMVTVVAP